MVGVLSLPVQAAARARSAESRNGLTMRASESNRHAARKISQLRELRCQRMGTSSGVWDRESLRTHTELLLGGHAVFHHLLQILGRALALLGHDGDGGATLGVLGRDRGVLHDHRA